MNKVNKARFENYMTSEDTHLSDVYGTWSEAKQDAYNKCFAIMYENHGVRPRIISANHFRFTFGFLYKNDEDTWMMMYIGTHRPEYWGAPVEQMLVEIDLSEIPVCPYCGHPLVESRDENVDYECVWCGEEFLEVI